METKTIYQKLGAVMAEVKAVDKAQKNVQQGFMFRGIDDMMNALHNLFAKHGIIVLPSELEHIQDNYPTKTGGTQFRSRVLMEFRFVSTDDGSYVTTSGWGEAADNGDKGYNKCKSIAFKYVLMQMFVIPTKDIADPDKETPEEVDCDSELLLLLNEIRLAESTEQLTSIYNRNQQYHTNTRFMSALSHRKKEVQ